MSFPDVTLAPLQLTRICDEACNARTREIVEFLRKMGANGPYYADMVRFEFLSDYIRQQNDEERETGTQRRGG